MPASIVYASKRSGEEMRLTYVYHCIEVSLISSIAETEELTAVLIPLVVTLYH